MSYSSDDDDQPLVFIRNLKPEKAKSSSHPPKPSLKPSNDSDSEDDKPLSSNISTVPKVNTNNAKNGSHKSVSAASKIKDDSKFISKPNVGSANKAHLDGSASRENQSENIGVKKRPLCEERSQGQAPIKKPKLSDSSKPVNRKPVNLKAETKSDDDDDDDNLSITQRMKNQASNKSKKVAKMCPIVMFERIQKMLEDVIMSNRRLTLNITKLTEKVANVCKSQAELQAAIDAITECYEEDPNDVKN